MPKQHTARNIKGPSLFRSLFIAQSHTVVPMSSSTPTYQGDEVHSPTGLFNRHVMRSSCEGYRHQDLAHDIPLNLHCNQRPESQVEKTYIPLVIDSG